MELDHVLHERMQDISAGKYLYCILEASAWPAMKENIALTSNGAPSPAVCVQSRWLCLVKNIQSVNCERLETVKYLGFILTVLLLRRRYENVDVSYEAHLRLYPVHTGCVLLFPDVIARNIFCYFLFLKKHESACVTRDNLWLLTP